MTQLFQWKNILFYSKFLIQQIVFPALFYKEEAQQTKRQKRPLPRILDGMFFRVDSYVGIKTDEKVEAVCTECGEVKKGNTNSTGNFKTHYSKMHSAKSKELEQYLKGNDLKSKLRQPEITEALQVHTDVRICSSCHSLIFYQYIMC